MAISILFNMINVGAQQRNGTVSVGEIIQSGWTAHAKQNQGQAGIFGISSTVNFGSIIIDNDLIDSPIFDNDATPSAQAQAL